MGVRERGGDEALGQQLHALMHDAIGRKPREAAGPRYQLVLGPFPAAQLGVGRLVEPRRPRGVKRDRHALGNRDFESPRHRLCRRRLLLAARSHPQ